VSSFANANHLPYLVLVDEDFHLADALGNKRVPSTLVIDRSGHIVYSGGAFDARSLAAFRGVLGTTDALAQTP
jgi:peroxiredoxin